MLHLNSDDVRPINELIVSIFRVGGSLLDGGSRLVADIGLTPAWWQVLGALVRSPEPLTVPQIARNMGLTRQSVQRIVDLLHERDLVRLEPNPNHRRARLVALTEAGEALYLKALERQVPWSRQLEAGIPEADLRTALTVLSAIEDRLASVAEQALCAAEG